MLRRVLLLAALAPGIAEPLGGQMPPELTETPEAAADAFLRSMRAISWGTTAELIYPETLERFRTLVSMIAAADTTGETGRHLTSTDSSGFSVLTGAVVFGRSIGSMMDDMPGLVNAFYDRDDEVLGHVVEGREQAHVVYRSLARIGGAVPEVKVMQLARAGSGWRVLWSDELAVLDAALRGVRTGRR